MILSFLIIDFHVNAQDSLRQLGERYGLEHTDTVIKYNPNTWQGDNQVELENTSKYFGAVIASHQLKENGLVIVLRTRSKQLDKLRILSRDKSFSVRQQSNIKARIEAIESENNLINKALLTGFSNNYRFSKYYFIYDTSLTSLKEGITKGIFLDNNGSIDNSIELKTTNFYICNYTLASSSNQSEGLVIFDAKVERVKSPFPGVAVSGSSGLNMLLQLLTDNDEHYNKKIQKDVLKLQKNLERIIEKGNKKFKKP